jgi:deoxyhypusine synthase
MITLPAAVLRPTTVELQAAVSVEGPNFDIPMSLQDLLGSYERIGFQATSLGRAIEIVNRMVSDGVCVKLKRFY